MQKTSFETISTADLDNVTGAGGWLGMLGVGGQGGNGPTGDGPAVNGGGGLGAIMGGGRGDGGVFGLDKEGNGRSLSAGIANGVGKLFGGKGDGGS